MKTNHGKAYSPVLLTLSSNIFTISTPRLYTVTLKRITATKPYTKGLGMTWFTYSIEYFPNKTVGMRGRRWLQRRHGI
jgi:hypothetical protein